jgi:hypothetical protein
MDGLSGLPIGDLGPWGLVGIAVALILMGRLVPRSTLEDTRRDRDSWRTAHDVSERARAELAQSVHDLLEHARTTDAFIRSLPHTPQAPPVREPT